MTFSAQSAVTEQKLLRQRLDTAFAEAAQPLSREEVTDIVRNILGSLDGDISATDLRLYKEVVDLAKYIETAKQEIAALQPAEIRDEHIRTATDELDAVIGATEKATFAIFDACDAIGAIAGQSDADTSAKLNEQITAIYEACNFQDITGQRISKVVRTLKHIESKVDMIVAAFGSEVRQNHAPRLAKLAAEEAEAAAHFEPMSAEEADQQLLHGPQLPGNAMDQDEIDRLLASFD
ncbi:chemotaxis protein CheZ [Azospirillum lipoferum]|uniref:Protein phosphatase CheZ n=1 Tax=Azospirillum lipoferum TaxID=193 RepID=A0A5A9GU69_AZOLI|nr:MULTISPECIES: protein phosphatase CheZ [Azospirillum]KAA0597315.1 protein phosphatase CheZ [Azospirillum lipoferum]MCP1608842.1 chemotaxis protein CheZ [Azospirillum lipoferum]MDW5535843.1 protein phosphatase CheZ [Azospirillum sp. NL1]